MLFEVVSCHNFGGVIIVDWRKLKLKQHMNTQISSVILGLVPLYQVFINLWHTGLGHCIWNTNDLVLQIKFFTELAHDVQNCFSDLYQKRRQFELQHNSQHLPLPWTRNFRYVLNIQTLISSWYSITYFCDEIVLNSCIAHQ